MGIINFIYYDEMKKCYLSLAAMLLLGAHSLVYAQSDKPKSAGDLLYSIIRNQGVEQAVQKYESLRAAPSGEYDLGEAELNKLGYKLLNDENLKAAAAIFELNVQAHPESVNVYDSQNDAFLRLGRYKEAAANYRKILEMLEKQDLPARQENLLRNKARINLYRVEHFVPPSDDTFNYVSYYGGNTAGHWDMENVAHFSEQIPELQISYIGNNLYFRPIPDNVDQTFEGEMPVDVATGFIGGYLRDFVEKGKLVDITNLWNVNNWDERFPEPFRRLATYKGNKYFVPMAYQWNPVFYRRDIFEKHGLKPPVSWVGLLDLCDRLHDLGYTPFSIAVQNWPPPIARWFSILDLRLNGADFHRQVLDGRISFKDDRIRDVFEHWRTLFKHHAFADSSYTFNYSDGIKAFTSGRAVMYNLGEWLFESLNETQAKKVDFFVFPNIDPNVPTAEIVHTYGAYMTSRAKHPAEARTLLSYLAGTKSQESNVRANHRIVANRKVNATLYSPLQRRIIQQVNQTDRLVPLFEFSTRPEFGRRAFQIFSEFWKNPGDIDATLEKLEEARKEVFE